MSYIALPTELLSHVAQELGGKCVESRLWLGSAVTQEVLQNPLTSDLLFSSKRPGDIMNSCDTAVVYS